MSQPVNACDNKLVSQQVNQWISELGWVHEWGNKWVSEPVNEWVGLNELVNGLASKWLS